MALFHRIRARFAAAAAAAEQKGAATTAAVRAHRPDQQHQHHQPSARQPMLPPSELAAAVPDSLFEWMAFAQARAPPACPPCRPCTTHLLRHWYCAQRHNAWRLKELLLAAPEMAACLQTGAAAPMHEQRLGPIAHNLRGAQIC
jgi:hypothetical protein